MDKILKFNQWSIVGIELGEAFFNIKSEKSYSKLDISDMWGVNLGSEYSEFHRCLVISKKKFNHGETIIVAPFTSYKGSHEGKDFCMVIDIAKDTEKFLSRKSTLILTQMKAVSKIRVAKVYGFLSVRLRNEIKDRVGRIFDIT